MYKVTFCWHTLKYNLSKCTKGAFYMRNVLTIVYDTLKVFIFFIGFTLLFYYGIVWLNDEYEGYHRYDKPHGGAVKVWNEEEQSEPIFSLERLYFFYHFGE
jgi:hypothetical protein